MNDKRQKMTEYQKMLNENNRLKRHIGNLKGTDLVAKNEELEEKLFLLKLCINSLNHYITRIEKENNEIGDDERKNVKIDGFVLLMKDIIKECRRKIK